MGELCPLPSCRVKYSGDCKGFRQIIAHYFVRIKFRGGTYMPIIPDFSNSGRILPKGEYKVVFDNQMLGKFSSLDEAQRFQSQLGKRGSRIITPNLRKDMT
jgi:hypothetical protein